MTQSIFDPNLDITMESLTVHTLLDECRALISEVEQSAIDQEEEDIFQCGKCKAQFTSLHLFILHKREHQKIQEQNLDQNHYQVCNETHIALSDVNSQCVPEYTSCEDHSLCDHLGEPIILEENDILFSMDQDSANYLTTDSNSHAPIIFDTEGLESFGESPTAVTADATRTVEHAQINVQDERISVMSNVEHAVSCTESDVPQQNTQSMQTVNKSAPSLNLKYKCNYCEKQFAKKFYWQQHERSHTGEKPYQCVVCGRPFAQKSNVKKHMSSHKVWPGTAIHSLPPEAPTDGSIERSYHCQFCKKIFDSYKALKGHQILSHLTLKVYKCVQYGCGKMFAELNDFLEHTHSHKRSEYRCHICGDAFNTLSDLGSHQYTHSVQKQKTTEKYYSCSICKSSFSNLEALQHHMETTTHDYACPHCGKSFLIERFLRRHLKTHATSSRYACEDCGKAFKTEQYLANHKLIHSEETPFSCPHCPARFKRKDRLGRHMLIHDQSKRLKCPFRSHLGCMSEFSRPDKLKRHLLTHSNIKRFNCSHCNRNFHRAQALKHHEQKKHNLKCDNCTHIFKTKDQLASHNCMLINDVKKYSCTQVPKRATGSFKPRKPTPKRQSSSKNCTAAQEKDKSVVCKNPKKNTIVAAKIDQNDLIVKVDSPGYGDSINNVCPVLSDALHKDNVYLIS